MSDKITVQIDRADAESLRQQLTRPPATYTPISRVVRAVIDALPPELPTKEGALIKFKSGALWARQRNGEWRSLTHNYTCTEDGLADGWTLLFEGVD